MIKVSLICLSLLFLAACSMENAPMPFEERPQIGGGGGSVDPVDPIDPVVLTPTFSSISINIFKPKCMECHGPEKAENKVRLDSYDLIMSNPDDLIVPDVPDFSLIYMVLNGAVSTTMPPDEKDPLSEAEVITIRDWILKGALND